MSIEIFAPDGVPEVEAGADLASLVVASLARDASGPLRDGDIVVVTSKIVSKAEGRFVPAEQADAARVEQTRRTVARRGPVRIVTNQLGITQAAAGIDASNVPAGQVLLLPADPDASARALRARLQELTGARVGVIVSDTSGRAWRIGQTDHAIGVAGVVVVADYGGQVDEHGHELRVTQMALADELAAAADLVKAKLAGRPVAVVRGLGHLVTDDPVAAGSLLRDEDSDMFAYGAREAVLVALLSATGQPERYEEIVELDGPERVAAVLEGARWHGRDLTDAQRELIAAVLR